MRHLLSLFSLLLVTASVYAEFQFPEKIGDYQRGERHDYDQEGLGYSVTYNGEGSWITVYVFDRGHDNIAEGIQGEFVKQALEEAIGGVKIAAEQGIYSNVTEPPMDPDFAPLKADFLMAKLQYTFRPGTDQEATVQSYIFCRGEGGEILKVRASGAPDADFAKNLLAFMLELRLEVMN